MKTFAERLTATRANLERLEALHNKHPDLFRAACGIYIEDDKVRVYINGDAEHDWLAFAKRWDCNWTREHSPVSGYDYRGTIGGVELCIISAEQRQEPRALFPEAGQPQELGA